HREFHVRDVNCQGLEKCGSFFLHLFSVEKNAKMNILPSEKDVFIGVLQIVQCQILIDSRDISFTYSLMVSERSIGSAIDGNLPGVGLQAAGNDFGKGTLARAIIPHNCSHLAPGG